MVLNIITIQTIYGETKIVYIDSNGELQVQYEPKLPNGVDDNDDFIKTAGLIDQNNMAKEYYKEAYKFREWFRECGLNGIRYSDAYEYIINSEGELEEAYIWEENDAKVFELNDTMDYSKNIENELSTFNQHRLSVIRHKIETNLAIAISNYNTYLGGASSSNVFQMPELKEDEWDYITHNISLISFLQGLPIGEKTYNGYTVVTNSESKEVVLEQNIYILGNDKAYHKIGDKYLEKSENIATNYNKISNTTTNSAGRLNLDFDRKRIQVGETKYYYYPLKNFNASYSSVVMQDNMTTYDDIYAYVNEQNVELKRAFYTAIGRERYGVYKTLSYVNINRVTQNMGLLSILYYPNANGEGVENIPDWQRKSYKETIEICADKTPKRVGYDFVEWNTSSDGTGKTYKDGDLYGEDKNLILYAIWKKATYNIVYDANGGDPTPEPDKKTHGDSQYRLSEIQPTKTGCKFLYWDAGNGRYYQPGDLYLLNNDVTLKARWEDLQYNITFNANGGTGGPGEQSKTYGEDFTIPSEEPTREGYEFLGWNTDPNAETGDPKYQAGSKYKDDDDITLHAIWKPKTFTISYNANGGTGAPASQTKNYGENLTLRIGIPTRTGYKFLGWATSKTGNAQYNPGDIYTRNASVTLYAKWNVKTYTVSYNANGGSGAPSSQTKTHGENLTLSSTKPTRTGYTFVNWNTKADGSGTSYNAGGSYKTNAGVTLYAVWKTNTYTVAYNANGGTGAPGSQTKTYGVDLTLSSTKPTRTGYKFLGWATSKTGDIAYQPGGKYTTNGNLTLYAKWNLTTLTGRKTCDFWGDETPVYKVEFKEAFSKVPTVTITEKEIVNNNIHGGTAQIKNVTKTGFEIHCKGDGNSGNGNTFYIHWKATIN